MTRDLTWTTWDSSDQITSDMTSMSCDSVDLRLDLDDFKPNNLGLDLDMPSITLDLIWQSLISFKYGCNVHFRPQYNQGCLIYLMHSRLWWIKYKCRIWVRLEINVRKCISVTQLVSVIFEVFGETEMNYGVTTASEPINKKGKDL